MKKVVAFLEQYAEWLALGVAAIFFLFVVWGYVISPTAVKVQVAGEELTPGEVDPKVNDKAIGRLQSAMESKAGDLVMVVPDFAKQFQLAMGPDRPNVGPEFLAGAQPPRPPQINQVFDVGGSTPIVETPITELPKMPALLSLTTASGNSLVAPPPPPVEAQAADPDALPVNNALPDTPEAQLANAMEKNWVTVEAKLPMKDVADEWKRVFYDMKTRRAKIPAAALQTSFLRVEVEREEQTGPDQWGNKVTLKPIATVHAEEFPTKEDDRQQQEQYRLWAEQHQVEVAEPAFFRVLKGDPWFVPSVGAPKDPAEQAVADGTAQPFDPANPPTDRPLTTLEKQQVYIYKQKERQEKQKADAQSRRQSTDAARRGGPSGGYGGGGGRRSLGGYNAPLPIELAAGQGVSDRNAPPPGGRGGGRPMAPNVPPGGFGPPGGYPVPPGGYGGRPGGPPGGPPPNFRPPAPSAGRPYTPPSGYAPGYNPETPAPTYDPATGMNSIPTGPFDPTRIPPNTKGQIPEMSVWAHDDTVVPGKTYRYRMRLRMKNPLYNSYNVAKDPELSKKFTLDTPWTEWKEVKAPRNTEFFFANVKQDIKTATVTGASVNVFRRLKGEWTMETFQVAPGDSIGGQKNGVDYSTGVTLVDLRPDVRGRDTRIMVADESGTIDRIDYNAQKEDEWYKTLLIKVRGPQPPPGSTPAATGGLPGYGREGGI